MKYQSQQKNGNLKSRKHLNADALFRALHTDFSKVAARRFELGETNYLEKITAGSKQKQINLKYPRWNWNFMGSNTDK